MSLTYTQFDALYTVKENTQETVKILRSMNDKMDRQIALLERIILALESRQDDGR